MPEPVDSGGVETGLEAAGAAPHGQAPSPARERSGSYRGRVQAAAAARGIPLATILTTVLVVFAVLDLNVLVVLLLWALRTVILYVVVAVFVTLLLSPPVHALQRLGLPRGVAVPVVFVLALLVSVGIVLLFTPPLLHAVTRFAKDLPTLVRQAEHGRGRIGRLLVRFHLERWVSQNAPKAASEIAKSLKPAQALSVGAAAASTLVDLGIIAVLSLFLLLDAPNLWRGFLGLFSPARAGRISRLSSEVSRSVTGYMVGNALTSIVAGVIVLVTLTIAGVPYPLLLGLWVALVDLLPMVGGLIAGVPVAVVALFHSLPAFIVVAVVFIVYQQVENHVLNPLVMSRTMRLNPLWVLLAVLVAATLGDRVWAGLGGLVGALVGIPIGGAVQVVVREVRGGAGDDGSRDRPAPGERATVS